MKTIVWSFAHSHATWSFAACSFLLKGLKRTVTKIFSSLALGPPGVDIGILSSFEAGVQGADVGSFSTFEAGVLGADSGTFPSFEAGVPNSLVVVISAKLPFSGYVE